jgi:predicted phosphodiesterase
MRYALLSDVHGHRLQLEVVLADAQARGADRIISLGDVGDDACVALLRQAGALAVFGNYEVSGWRRLSEGHRAWVRSWPPMLQEDGFLAVHAAPWWPRSLHSAEQFRRWLERTGHSWRSLFPYMTEDEDHLLHAVAELEMTGKSVIFHGHTHRQTVWRLAPSGAMERVSSRSLGIERSYTYVVGVGSVGLPEDGGWAAYALYDADASLIDLVRLSR